MAQISVVTCFLVLIVFLLASFSQAEEEAKVYEIKRGDFSLKVTNYGATVVSVVLPDKSGKLSDIVLGYDSIKDYMNGSNYFGALVGRVANRIGGAKFTLNGTVYKLPANDGKNTLHGGIKGFSKVMWTIYSYKKDSHITFTYNSYDGQQGFPGKLFVRVTYMLIETNKLAIKMKAKALNKATPVNLASHTYWNLAGQNSGNILSHSLQIFGSKITPVDNKLIPTGKIVTVKGTQYDFLQPRLIGSKIDEFKGGYDINYVLDNKGDEHLKKVAVVQDSKSGRQMELWTNQPGVQVYTSNMLSNVTGKGGYVYSKYAGLCLETQGFPDSVNHPNFPSQIVNPGETYEHIMVYRFTT